MVLLAVTSQLCRLVLILRVCLLQEELRKSQVLPQLRFLFSFFPGKEYTAQQDVVSHPFLCCHMATPQCLPF